MLQTKYGFAVPTAEVKTTINRLTNQIWKLIPMRENAENWKTQIETVIVEIVGLNEIFINPDYISLLAKLEGLLVKDLDFLIYRKTVFESIAILQGLLKDE